MEARVRLSFDGKTQTREVTACFPREEASDVMFVFCADGQHVPYFAEHLEDELAAGHVGLIGVHSSPAFRGQDYVLGRDEQCFEGHESFFIHVVRAWAQTQTRIPLAPHNTTVWVLLRRCIRRLNGHQASRSVRVGDRVVHCGPASSRRPTSFRAARSFTKPVLSCRRRKRTWQHQELHDAASELDTQKRRPKRIPVKSRRT
jgi:hypothetical protein